jgi:protoporphyrinogen oxidase
MPTKVGFYDNGRLFSMTSLRELLTFPLLGPAGRIRLGAFAAYCQLKRGHDDLDDAELMAWLRRKCGRRAVERLWAPLLDSKFDGRYDDLPATYIWARSRRMAVTRDSSGREVMGWLQGGYQTLVDALEARIKELGGEVRAGTQVDAIYGSSGRAAGLIVDNRFRPFDHVVSTLAPPASRSLLSPELAALAPADPFRYLGVVCLLLRVSRSVSPYYHLNITDRRIPLTTLVETTHVVDPDHVGGTLLYASKYVDPGHEDLSRSPQEVERDYLGHVRTMFPTLRDDEILGSVVQRARIVEPVHLVGGAARVPPIFSVPGLALASTAHVYPEIVSGQAVTGVAERVVAGVLDRLDVESRAAA